MSPILKEKTKRGEFLVQVGNASDKNSSEFEKRYLASLSDAQRSQMVWDLFVDYHVAHGTPIKELRLDRTTVLFGRRKSKVSNRRRSRSS